MATPKRKHSHRRTALRAAHWFGKLDTPATTVCSHCGETIPSYTVCPACGYYRGRKVMAVAADKAAEADKTSAATTPTTETKSK